MSERLIESPDGQSYHIRPVQTMNEIHGIVEVQRQAWQMDDLGIVPTFETKAVSKIGVVLIAVDSDETVIGFIYAYPQFPRAHYSHMMAVLPSWHGKNVGLELKRYHREIALASEYNINQINWTVDPLLPNNAYLNFRKLGGVCNTYYVDFYGSPDSEGVGIYAGLETDRFLVNWNIDTEHVAKRMEDKNYDWVSEEALLQRSPCINYIEGDQWIDRVENGMESFVDESFTVEVPSDFQTIKEKNMELAIEWRIKFRKVCLEYFENGWIAVDYHSYKNDEDRRNYYEFRKSKRIGI